MDLHEFLMNMFTVLAYGLPLVMAIEHFRHAGWKAGPPAYAGIVAAIAAYAMSARMSVFLAEYVTEPKGGWWSREELVALFLAGLSAVAMAVFLWLIPAIKTNLVSAAIALRNAWTGQRDTSHGLDFGSDEPRFPFLSGHWASFRHLLIAFAGTVMLFVYLAWPVFPLAIDQTRNEANATRIAEVKNIERRRNDQLRAYALQIFTQFNSLRGAISARQDRCTSDGCKAWAGRQLSQVMTELEGLGIAPRANRIFDAPGLAARLEGDHVQLASLHATLDKLSQRYAVRIEPIRKHVEEEPDVAHVEEIRRERFDVRLAQALRNLLAHPEQIFVQLAKDASMTLALGLELAAILAVFCVSGRRQQPS